MYLMASLWGFFFQFPPGSMQKNNKYLIVCYISNGCMFCLVLRSLQDAKKSCTLTYKENTSQVFVLAICITANLAASLRNKKICVDE